ncbi:MAG: type II secretion system F family protein [Methylococcales bacterium]|nr:type II secretion system F family protein [Methylococcales bacterium]
MTLFAYKAMSGAEIEEGFVDAADNATALARLQAQGLLILELKPSRGRTFLGISLGASGFRLKHKDLMLFTGELATLLESGLPLDKSLLVLIDLADSNAKLAEMIARVLNEVKGGRSLADALQNQGVFSRFYLNMIRAGEAGGNLGGVLARLADYLERAKELRDTVATALIYPAILLVMSLASLFVMLTYVVPQFQEMFDSAGQELPVPTQIVVALADGLQSWGWLLPVLAIGISVYFQRQYQDEQRRRIWDGRWLKLPLLGVLLRNMETANFARTLGTLLSNGVSILNALAIAKETVGNRLIASALADAEERLKRGKPMSDALIAEDILPKLATQMIRMGEETGRLEEMLQRVAVIYDKQLKIAIQRLLALLEPVLIIGLGLLIGGIIVSILLAILSVNDLAL